MSLPSAVPPTPCLTVIAHVSGRTALVGNCLSALETGSIRAVPRHELNPALLRKAFDRLTTQGRAAATRFNERPQYRACPGASVNSAGRSCVVVVAKGRAAAPAGSDQA